MKTTSITPPPPPSLNQKIAARRLSLKNILFLLPATLLLTTCKGGSLPPAEAVKYTATVTGTVQDNAGAKLPGATVSASTTPPVTTTSGLDGAFSLRVTGSAFTLTVAKTCYGAPSTKSITLSGNGPLDTGATTLSLKPEPTEESERYTFTQKPDGSYKLTVKECVTTIPRNEFSAEFGNVSPIVQRYVTSSTPASDVISEIQLPSTLKTISSSAFYRNMSMSGNVTIPKTVDSIGDNAFFLLGANFGVGVTPSTAASSPLPEVTFESGSGLKTIGQSAFESAGVKIGLVLPEGVETIGAQAFKSFKMPSTDLVIPASVRKIGNEAFRSASGITGVTIRSTNLTKDATDPRLGTNLFGESSPGGGASSTRLSTITTIKLPLAVYNSYTATERTAIFGSEITTSPNGYQDLAGNPHP